MLPPLRASPSRRRALLAGPRKQLSVLFWQILIDVIPSKPDDSLSRLAQSKNPYFARSAVSHCSECNMLQKLEDPLGMTTRLLWGLSVGAGMPTHGASRGSDRH